MQYTVRVLLTVCILCHKSKTPHFNCLGKPTTAFILGMKGGIMAVCTEGVGKMYFVLKKQRNLSNTPTV